MNEHSIEAVTRLVKSTGKAHHKYQTEELGGEWSPAWANWYAAFMLENGLEALLNSSINEEQLVQTLQTLDREYKQLTDSGAEVDIWPNYYGRRLVELFADYPSQEDS